MYNDIVPFVSVPSVPLSYGILHRYYNRRHFAFHFICGYIVRFQAQFAVKLRILFISHHLIIICRVLFDPFFFPVHWFIQTSSFSINNQPLDKKKKKAPKFHNFIHSSNISHTEIPYSKRFFEVCHSIKTFSASLVNNFTVSTSWPTTTLIYLLTSYSVLALKLTLFLSFLPHIPRWHFPSFNVACANYRKPRILGPPPVNLAPPMYIFSCSIKFKNCCWRENDQRWWNC